MLRLTIREDEHGIPKRGILRDGLQALAPVLGALGVVGRVRARIALLHGVDQLVVVQDA